MIKNLQSLEKNLIQLRLKDQPFSVEREGFDIRLVLVDKRSKDLEVENAYALCQYLIDLICPMHFVELESSRCKAIQAVIEEAYLYVKYVIVRFALSCDEVDQLRALSIAMKIGGKVPVHYLLDKKNVRFLKFIECNYFHNYIFSFRMQLPFDSVDGPSIPIYAEERGIVWVHFENLVCEEAGEELIFHLAGEVVFVTNLEMILDPDYAFFYQGIRRYNVAESTNWIPFDFQDSKEWGSRHIAEVWTLFSDSLENSPLMFRKTHAYLVLKDDIGHVRSVGQDVIMTIKDYKVTELLSVKKGLGKILTPDASVFYPKNSRYFEKTTFNLTKKQHDKMIQIVEADKRNEKHTISVMRGNCVSYVLKLLREAAHINLDASMHAFHVFSRSLLPSKLYHAFFKPFDRWYNKQSVFVQKAIFFFPPFYICHILFGLVAMGCKRRNFENRHEFYLRDIFLRPWTMSCDHPHQLVKILSSIPESLLTPVDE